MEIYCEVLKVDCFNDYNFIRVPNGILINFDN